MAYRSVYRQYLGIALGLFASAGVALAACSGTTTVTCTGGSGAALSVATGNDGPTTAATPYPASITVTGAPGGSTVATVSVTINGYTTANGAASRSMGLLLKSPGNRNLEIMRSVGRGSIDTTNATITIADGNPSMTSACVNGGNNGLVSGTFAPSAFGCSESGSTEPNYAVSGGPTLAHSAQTNGTSTLNGVFAGDTPNGTWSLYLVDDAGFADVSFTSWSITITVSSASTPSTTTLTPNPTTAYTSSPNNTVTLTAVVTSGATGTVTFKDGATNLLCGGGNPAPISSNQAVCSTTFSTEGIHQLSANYSGDSTFVSSSGTANVYIQNHATNTGNVYCNTGAISNNGRSDLAFSNTSPYPSVIFIGDGVNTDITNSVNTVSVTLKNFSSNGMGAMHMLLVAPDGTHAYDFWSSVGSTAGAGNYTIVDGSPQIPNSAISPGSYSPTADGVPPDPFNPFPPAPAPQVPASWSYAPPEGNPNSQTFQTAFVGAPAHGAWSLFLYNGSGATAITSAAGGWCLNVSPATGFPTTVTETATPVSSALGSSVTFNATVGSSGHPTPNQGTVTFTENGSPLTGAPNGGVANVSGGVASISTSSLPEGDHIVSASYHDSTGTYNDNFGTFTVRVDKATSTPTLNGSTWTYCNTGAITIPRGVLFVNDFGPGTPNPSNLFVTKLPGTINTVGVTLNGFTVFRPVDLETLLVGPGATTNNTLDFFSQTGGISSYGPANTSFLDGAATVPAAGPVSGSNGPTSRGGTSTYTPSPFYTLPSTFQYATTNGAFTFDTGTYTAGVGGGVFKNTLPNGTWSLYFNQLTHSTQSGVNNGWCANFLENPVTVSATKGHTGRPPSGHFQQGHAGASFSFDVTNNGDANGLGSTGDPDGNHGLQIVDVLDSGSFTPGTLPTGTPWNCAAVVNTVTCKSSLSVAPGSSYPTLTIPVNVKNNAPASANNQGSLSGGGITPTTSNTDTVTIDPAPVLAISKSHTGTFTQGQTGTWTLQVSNNSATAAGNTDGTTVTVTDTLPSGYSGWSGSGTGWVCNTNVLVISCTSSEVVNGAGGLFQLITLTGTVPATSPTSVTNNALVFGGGDVIHTNSGNAATTFETLTVIQVPASISINGSATQSAGVGTAFGSLAVTVKDAASVVIPNYSSVVFTAIPGGSGQSGTFDNSTATKSLATNGSGVADPGVFTANAIPGAYTVDVAAGPATHATFNLTNTAPDMTAVKTDNVSGATTLGNNWTWTIHLANAGNSSATFGSGTTILTDNLPATGLTYGSPFTSNPTGIVGNVSCAIVSNVLSCTALGTVIFPGTTGIDVSFLVTPATIGTYVNPTGGVCSVDPGNVVTESNESNNTCTDTVVVTAADLSAVKTDNVSNATTLGTPWTWKIHLANTGSAAANFATGNTILTDNLPATNISYGSASISNAVGITGTINCSITSNVLSCTASGAVAIGATTGALDVSFTATPTAIGTFVNPTGGVCKVDPSSLITESDETNNACSDTVTVTAPDLTALKTDNVSGNTTLGTPWTWNIHVANAGNAAANFTTGQTILTDNLPATNIGYGAAGLANATGITGTINCAIASNVLTCTAGNAVSIAAPGSFDVSFTATATAAGTFANPTGGVCAVDPATVIPESNEGNNSCSDTVIVTAPDLSAVKSNNVSGTTSLGNNFTWKIHLANSGNAPANFANGATILTDSLPGTNITYGSASTANAVGITGTINCGIASNVLTCTASGPVIIGATTGAVDVNFTATATAIGTFVNPTGGVCAVDPGSIVTESNEGNNSCTDTVTVTAADLTAVKSNNVSGSATAGVPFTWKIHIANAGNATANFATGNTILTDNLPATNIAYGSASTSNASGITGTINCGIASNVLSCTASGAVAISAAGSIDVSFTATASAAGSYVNPTGGVCAVDPGNVVSESNESNNACSDTVNAGAADLTATKSDNVSNAAALGSNWTWKIHVANGGNAGANFATGNTILTDSLPSTNIAYGSASISNPSGVTGTINCGITSNILTCSASGAVVLAAAGSFDVSFTATPSAIGTFVNPTGGSCAVDPSNVIVESAEGNNTCADTVVVTAPDLTVAKTHSPSNFAVNDSNDLINITVTNAGNRASSGTVTVTDTLPAGLTFNGTTSAGWSCNANGSNPVVCSSTTAINGSNGTSGLSLKVNVASSTSSPLTNSVSVACTCTESNTGNNTGGDSIPVLQLVPLNINVSPVAGAGTFTPASGSLFAPGSVVNITATPNAGYAFVNWTGGTFGSAATNSTNTVTVNGPTTITANFIELATSLLGSIASKTGTIGARTWNMKVVNGTPGAADFVQITSFTLTQTAGTACTPHVVSGLNTAFANIPPGGNATQPVLIDFTGCPGNAKFSLNAQFSANNGAATTTLVRNNETW